MDRGYRKHFNDILQECLELSARAIHLKLLQTPDAYCVYAQLSHF